MEADFLEKMIEETKKLLVVIKNSNSMESLNECKDTLDEIELLFEDYKELNDVEKEV